MANGGVSPRMLCLDDYFMVDVEKTENDAETGKMVKRTVCSCLVKLTVKPVCIKESPEISLILIINLMKSRDVCTTDYIGRFF